MAEVFEHGASLARCSIASGNKRGRHRPPLAVFWRQAPKTVRHEFLQVAKRSGVEGFNLVVGCCVFLCVWALCDNLSLCDVCVQVGVELVCGCVWVCVGVCGCVWVCVGVCSSERLR